MPGGAGAGGKEMVIENLLACAPDGTAAHYYRSSGGAEADLLLVFPGGERWAVEVKRSLKPRPERGFHAACQDLDPARRFVVYPGVERYPLSAQVEAIALPDFAAELHRRGKALPYHSA